MVKKIWKKIIFEMRMQIMDARWRNSMLRSCWEVYPPSFYYRYTPEEQRQIKDKHFAEIRAMLEEFEGNRL
ncbi:MAG: hypothetical protein IJD40_11860 [Lachnospiraceae bacterium]|nr:hypothetical protein [Lachnospiraceae bacterium]